MANLTPELEQWRKQIEEVSRGYGLDCFTTIFELVPYNKISEIAALGGFPVRYPHWKFGMEYEQLSKSYEYGLSKIYEMVINTDPCYAYLMEGNTLMDQKLVMAHVYGHCDFFKNNIWFSKTNRKMVDQMANHGTRISRYMDRYGQERVEAFIDKCLSLENLIDRYSVFNEDKQHIVAPPSSNLNDYLLKSNRQYMDKYINPPEFVKEQQQKMMDRLQATQNFPEQPEKDVLKFLIDNAPLTDWEADVLSIIRAEAYYFSPQGMTKTMNEGWASYWHSKILTNKILDDSEIIEFAQKHSGVMGMAPNGYNPYKVGIELFRNIEERWNKGQYGREWNECDDAREKKNWDKKTMEGRAKMFEIRKLYNDVSFITEFLTEDFCMENKMFVYSFNPKTQRWFMDSTNPKKVKEMLLFKMTNFGQPIISVENANFENRGEMLLGHLHEGMDLQKDFLEETLKNVFALWRRPVNLRTVMEQKETVFRFDGEKITVL